MSRRNSGWAGSCWRARRRPSPEFWRQTTRDQDTAARVLEALYVNSALYQADPAQAIVWLGRAAEGGLGAG